MWHLELRCRFSLVAVTAVSLGACHPSTFAPDAAQIEEQIAASRVEEVEVVRSTIDDPERTQQFLELMDERDLLLERIANQVAEHRRVMNELNADYHAGRSQLESLIAQYNDQRFAAQQDIVILIARMKRVTTAEEWTTISAFQVKRLDFRKLAYRSNGEVS